MYKLTDTFVLILWIFAVFLSVAYTTLNKLFAVFCNILCSRKCPWCLLPLLCTL